MGPGPVAVLPPHLGLLSQETLRKIAVKRLGRPDEVADAVAFLIKNKYANNCELNLDGGLFI